MAPTKESDLEDSEALLHHSPTETDTPFPPTPTARTSPWKKYHVRLILELLMALIILILSLRPLLRTTKKASPVPDCIPPPLHFPFLKQEIRVKTDEEREEKSPENKKNVPPTAPIPLRRYVHLKTQHHAQTTQLDSPVRRRAWVCES